MLIMQWPGVSKSTKICIIHFQFKKKMPINICSNLFDVSIPNVFVMYSFWVSILNYLYNTFELNESKNINNNAEPNVMKENPSLYLFDIVLTTYHFSMSSRNIDTRISIIMIHIEILKKKKSKILLVDMKIHWCNDSLKKWN